MTPSEFKAWFDGFTEALDKAPNDEQWKRIKARVAEIDGHPITAPIYIERYWPTYPRYYYYGTPYVYGLGYGTTGINLNCSSGGTGGLTNGGASLQNFNSHEAMLALGRAEANVQ